MILRHKPETIGITLDEHGWADVQELIDGINQSGGHMGKGKHHLKGLSRRTAEDDERFAASLKRLIEHIRAAQMKTGEGGSQ